MLISLNITILYLKTTQQKDKIMSRLTLIAMLTASMLTTASAEMFGGVIGDMMDIPKEIITSGTDAMRDVKDSVKDINDDDDDDVKKEETKKSAVVKTKAVEKPKVTASKDIKSNESNNTKK